MRSEGQQTGSAAGTLGMMPESLHGGMREPYSHNMYFQWDEFSSIVPSTILISGHSTYLYTSLGSYLSVPAWN